MRTILPFAKTQNITILPNICQSVKNFAWDLAENQSQRTSWCRTKWHYARVILLLAIGFFLAGAFQANGQINQVGSPQSATTGSTTLTINKPSGLAINNVMIAQIVQTGGGNSLTDATRTGWTQIAGSDIRSTFGDRCRATLLYRIATSSDVAAASFSFTLNGNSGDGEGGIIAFSGVDLTTGPFDVTPGTSYTNIASDNSFTATSITTVTNNSAVIMFGAINNNYNLSNWLTTNPGSLTELYDLPFNAGVDMGLGAAWSLMPTAGSTGTGTATISTGDYNGAILIALRPILPPSIASFSPGNGCTGSGESVVITGTNFTGATAVTFYNNRSASFTVDNATQITATLPAGAATGPISVTTPGGTSTSSSDFTIKPLPQVNNSPLSQTICSGETTSEVTLNADIVGTTFAWTGNGTSGVSGFIANGTNPIPAQTITTTGSAQGTVTYAITPTADGCAGPVTNYIIYVNPSSVGGTATAASPSLCSGSHTTVTLSGYTGSIQWQQSATGIDGWNNVSGGSGATTSTYTTADLTSDTYYRAEVTSGNCSSDYSTVVAVTINIPATPDTPASDSPQCADAGVTLTANGSPLPGEAWYWQGTNANGTSTANIASSPYIANTSGIYYIRSRANAGLCWGNAASVDVIVNSSPVNRVVAAEASSICSGNATNITVASSLATTSYQLRIGNNSFGLPIIGNGGTIDLPTGALTSTTTYNVLATIVATDCKAQMITTPTVTVNEAPTATAGGDQTICQNGSAFITGATATNYASVLWTHNGSGTLSGQNTLTPTYSAASGDAGHTVILTLTAVSDGCTPATDFYTVHVDPLPTAVAGGSDAICPGGSATVTGTSSSNGTISWTHNGSGTLSNATTLNPTYNSVPGDIVHPTITLTMTVTSVNACASATATAFYTLVVTPTTAVAGDDMTACSGTGPVDITTGANAGNYEVTAWSTNGTGTFSDPNSLTDCTYTPSTTDIANGSVTITLTAYTFLPCSDATSSKTLTIYSPPVVAAGTTVTTCSDAGAVNITAGSSASNYTSVKWTSSDGTGTFVNDGNLSTCTYLPSTADKTAGHVTLILTAYADAPCINAVSSKTLNIVATPTASAGTAVTTCSNSAPVNITAGATANNYASISWSSNGSGSFTNRTSLSACTYQPSAADKTAGSVTITLTATGNSPCGNVLSIKTLTITAAPTAAAGTAMAICYTSGSIDVTGGASATNYSSILWTSSGTGTFTNASSLTSCTYTPSDADLFAGSVTLTLTASGNSPCSSAISTKILTVTPAPTSNAGTDIYTCSTSGAVNITDGSDAKNYSSVTWTSNGTGVFTNANSLTDCIYAPSAGDIAAGGVILTLTAYDDLLCPNSTSTKTLSITAGPTATAGGNQTICVNGSYTLSGGEATSSNGTVLWTHNGAGILAGSGSLTPTYQAAVGDAGKIVTLTLTVTNSSCAPVTATYLINVNGLPTASAGGSQTICLGGTATVSGATATNGTISWTHNGVGSLSNATTLTPIYTPAAGDAGKVVTLTLTVTSINACAPVTATATYNVNVTQSTANAGNPVTTCALAGAVNITSGAGATNYAGISWSSSGSGTFVSKNSLTACTYTPSVADIALGSVTITLTAFVTPPCINATSSKTLTINPAPRATAGGNQTICENGTATVSGASSANGTILWTHNGTGLLSNQATLTPTYTAASGDAGKTVTLTMTVTSNNVCFPATATATYTVNVTALPTASAGGSQTICENGTAIVSDASASNGTILWTHNGAGSFSNENTLFPTYHAVHGDAGNTVILTMTVTSDNACSAATATATYTVIVKQMPTASAGGSQTICENGTASVSGASATNGTILWSHNGAGSLINGTTLTPTYIAAAGDAGTTVTLTITVTNNPCADATATYTVAVEGLPTATAGGNLAICQNQTATVFGTSSSNGIISWTENGAGSITSGNNTLTPTYTPTAADAGNTVTLTMTVTSNNACSSAPPATAIFTVDVRPLPTALAGGSQTICENGTATVTGASAANGTILWTHNGSGSLSNATTVSPTYTPGAGDKNNTVTLTMTVSDGPCSEATAEYFVTVDPMPFASAGGSTTICSSGSATVSGATTANGTILWTHNGSGILTNETTATPTYTAVKADAGKAVVLTMTVTSNNSCGTATATAIYTVHVQAEFPLTTGVTICQRGTGNLTSSSTCNATPSNQTGTGSGGTINNNNYGAGNTNISIVFPSLPVGAIVTSTTTKITYTSLGTGVRSEVRVRVTPPSAVGGVQSDLQPSTLSGNGTVTDANFGTYSTGNPVGTWLFEFRETSTHSSQDPDATISNITITVVYNAPGSIQWFTAPSGGTSIGSGASFNPVGVSGSGIPNTDNPGNFTFYAECSSQPGCRTATNFTILAAPAKPTLTASGSTSICTTGAGFVTLESSSATGNKWYRNAVLIPGATSQTYNATQAGDYTLTVSDATCTSLASDPLTVTSTAPSITTDPTASTTCFDASNTKISSLAYSATTNNPTIYSITWEPTPANNFVSVNDGLPVSPINITVPANTALGIYTGHISVQTADGCWSIPQNFTLTVNQSLDATFNYVSTLHNAGNGNPQYCQANPNNPIPNITSPAVAGTFSAIPAGLVFSDISTGKIDLAASNTGTYTITNTVSNGGCTSTFNQQVEILSLPAITIHYNQPGFCIGSGPQNVTRTINSDIFGSYSTTTVGLSINGNNDSGDPNAGQITPSLSVPGIYTVKYIYQNATCSGVVTTTVEIYALPAFTTQPSSNPVSFCQGGTATPLTVAANPGSGATISNYEWFGNSTASTIGATSVGTGANFSPITTSVGTLYYYCIVTDSHGCSAASDFSGPVRVNPPIANNDIFGENTLCSTEPMIELPGSLPTGGDGTYAYEWRSSSDGINFNTVVGTEQNYLPVGLTVNTWFNRTVTSGGCSNTTSLPVKITIIPGPTSFTVSGTTTVCWGESSVILLSGSEAGVTYQLRDNSGNPIGAPINGDGFAINFATGVLTSTITYNILASSTLTFCTGQMSGTPTVTVIPAITENSIGSSQTACPGSAPLRLDGSAPVGGIGNFLYKWQISTNNFSTYSDAPGVNDGQNYYPDVVTTDTWYRRIVMSDICSSVSNIVKMTLGALPAVVSVDGPTGGRFCGSVTLTASLVAGTGTTGTIYYQNTISGGLDIRYPQSSVSVNTSGTYYFRAYNVATGCWGPEGSFTVALDLPPATLGTTICQDQTGYLTAAAQCPSPVSSVSEFAGTGADDASIGTITWNNPGNIAITGNATASAVPENGGITHYLKATNFNFSIPAGAAIQGVTVLINHSSSGNISPFIRDNNVRLIQGGSMAGSNRAKPTTDWPTTMGTATYGGVTDTWGTTNLSAADINAPNFGVALSAINSNTSTTIPVVAGRATSAETGNTFTHHINLPSGIVANDLLLIFWSDRQRSGAIVTAPSGWTELYRDISAGGARRIAWYKIATGTEGTTLTLTTTGGTGNDIRSAHNSYRIAAGTYQGNPTVGLVASGSSSNPNPPNLTSGFGAVNTLWIAASHSGGAFTVTGPAGYSNLIDDNSGNTGTSNATMASATRATLATSEDPGTFNISTSGEWAANTIAIKGAPVKMDANVDYVQITVTAIVNGVINWYTSATGGTPFGSGVPFNPAGVTGSGLANTSVPGTYKFWSECSNVPGCRTEADFVINSLPAPPVTIDANNTYIYDATVKTATASAGGGETIDWYTAASGSGSAIAPTASAAGTYTAYAEARNLTTGCVSATRTLVTLTIQKRPITITADAQTKVYGDTDPALTYQITSGTLAGSDLFSGLLTRDPGENVGSYAILNGTVALSSNYILSYIGADLTITTRPIEITADTKTKIYGDADPSLTYQITTGSLAFSDTFTGALTRDAGEDVGDYPITRGTVALTSNYVLTYIGANLSITARPITITADAKTKAFGDPDPAFTYQITSGNLIGSDAFSGSLSRVSGEDVGIYGILQGTVALSSNYNLTYVGANLTIQGVLITVTADVQTKVYGDADPILTYHITSGSLVGTDTFSGFLSRDPGENVGNYAITQGSLSLSGNYTIIFVGANLTITPLAITITADTKTKVYGDADPSLTYNITSGSLAFSDVFAGALTRDLGENVGTYAITQGTVALNSNYTLAYIGANLTITAKAASVTPNAASKTYGDVDPSFTGTLTGFLAADNVTAVYSRTLGETAGTYPISAALSPAGVLVNYDITYNTADFTILPKIASVTPNAASKIYGDTDPVLTGTLTGFLPADLITATYSRTAGETVAGSPYTISAVLSPAGVLANYAITYNTADFNITPMAVASVTPDAASKIYGDADPSFTGTLSGFLAADNVTAVYSRTSGETAGTYLITAVLSPAEVLSNYNITYNTANFTILPKVASVTPDAASKTYGDADPSFTGTLTGFLAGDNVTATYSRTTGETVGGSPYTISAILSPAGVLSNYTITYNTAAFAITSKAASVTPDGASKTYGDSDPAFTGTLTGFVAGDNVTATYSRTAGETVAGSPYTISATLSPAAILANYTITYSTASFTITSKSASVTPDASGKTYGDSDPAFTGTLTGFMAADNVTATYSRAIGETAGTYAISALLSPAGVLGNYNITYNPADFTILPKAASVTPDASGKTYSDTDPAFTGVLSGFLIADNVTATYSRTAGETVAGSPYTISAVLSPAGVLNNYTITYNTANFTITPKVASVTPDVSGKTYGDVDPAFTGTLSGFLPGDNVTATYSRTAGETVAGSPYTISATLSPAAVLGNYNITYNTAAFTITAKAASVTPDASGKTYGDIDPAFTGTLSGFMAGDNVTATYSRTTGETVAGSPYTISATLSPAAVLGNYNITYNTAVFSITAKAASVTPDGSGKTYGDIDPAFTGTLSGFMAADNVTATYSRTAGETVAGNPYTISATLSPAAILANYTITYNTANFTITTKTASVSPNASTKVYGDVDPAFTGTLTGFLAGDNVTAAYSRISGETVAGSPYTISAVLSPAGVLGNYNITYNVADFTITQKAASVTPDAASKIYGEADPVFTGTLSGFLAGDNVTAVYLRATGEAAGTYPISAVLSPAAILGNYNITNNVADFTILPKAASVTPDAASKIYGDADPVFTGTITGFLPADNVTATYSRTAGETVLGSPYTISAVLSPAGVLANYTITYNTANFTITTKTASVTPDASTKVYGDVDPAFTGTLTGFLAGDNVTAAYNRISGETVAGSPYTISAVLSPAGVLANYTITYNSANFTITTKTASVTPDASTKVYGDLDPAFTGTLTGFLAGDNVTAAYSRISGETVAGSPYTISAVLSPAGVLANYNITYNVADFTITQKAASVTPNAATKVYGSADPALTGTLTGFLPADLVTATYTRIAGETVSGSPYTISASLSPVAVLGNYTITYNTADFTITPLAASVTPNAATKVYGGADPAFTGTLTGFLPADLVTATYTRIAGETVGGSPYTISASLSPIAVLGNYTITYNTADFTITPLAASVTPNAATKVYGGADPALTGTLTGFLPADLVTATYTRIAGETVGGSPYTISASLNPIAVLGNYTITYNTADFTITPIAASVTPNAATKVYGGADPAFTGTLTGFLPADLVTATYTRIAGETVGGSPYTISASLSPVVVLGNYTITYNTADFTITPLAASVTPNAATKVYGGADPAFTGTLTGFLPADLVTATYTRIAGETVGGSPYTISASLSPVAVLGNYTITYNTADFTITPLAVSVTPNAATKVYGSADPAFTGTLTGFLPADLVTATYTRIAGETVVGSPYPISASLSPVAVLGNYTITYNTADFTITPLAASVTPNAATKVYGSADPAFTGTLTGFLPADLVTATYTRIAGETVGGSPYTISASLSPVAVLGNYTITYNTADFTITPIAASVTPNAATKVYGGADPAFTGTLTGFLPADLVTATYTRIAGETVGGSPYTISATLSPAGVLGNYDITYNTANFTITALAASVTPDPASKIYGNADPAFTGTLTGFLAGDNVTATYSRTTGETVAGSPYAISATLSPAGVLANYTITYNTAAFTILPRLVASVTPDAASKTYGDADPVFTGTLTGFLPADNVTATYSRTTGETVSGSPYTISAVLSPAGILSNYTVAYNTANFTILPKVVSVTPDASGKTYGDIDPAFTGVLSGFLAADNVTATYSRTAGETVSGSPYTISAVLSPAGVLGNYTITYNTADFTITRKAASVTPDAASKTYGAADPVFTGVLSGFLPADNVTATYSRALGETAGTYTISAVLSPAGVLGNYNITYNTAIFNITPKALTITASNRTKSYGDVVAFAGTEFTTSGLINGDQVTSVTLTSAGAASTATVTGGPYSIIPSAPVGSGLGNYTISYVNGSLTVNAIALTITATNRTKNYGEIVTFNGTEFTTGGLLNSDAVTSVTLTSAGAAAGATVAGSPYAIIPSLAVGTGLSNYTIGYVNGTLSVNQAALTITANNASKVYGTVKTYLGTEFTTTGLANGNTVTSVTLTSTGDPATATVGAYTLTASAAVGTGLNNYTINYVNSVLTVDPKALPITASDRTKIYGDVVTFTGSEFTVPAGSLVNGDAVTSVTIASTGAVATAPVAGSPYPIVASAATGIGLGNYAITYVNGILTVSQKALTITAANQSKIYGQLFTFTGSEFTSAGLINGNTISGVTLTSAGAAATATVAGSPYAIVPSLVTGTGLDNYAISYINGVFTVTTKTLTITAADRTKMYGDVITFAGTEFTTSAGSLVNGDAVSGVTLTSTGAPASATVAGSPYPIIASAATGSGLGNYTVNYINGSLTVNQRLLTVGGSFTANNKEYDGTTVATIASNNLTLLTLVGSDVVTLNASAVFADKVVGTGKPVTLTGLSITGAASANYTLSLAGLPTATANITAKVLTIGGTFTVNNKAYDGTTAATIANNNLTLLTKVGADNVNLTSRSSL